MSKQLVCVPPSIHFLTPKSVLNYLHYAALFYIKRILQILKMRLSGAQPSITCDAAALPLCSWWVFNLLVLYKEPRDAESAGSQTPTGE